MIDVLTELLGGGYGLPSRQIYRSIISPQARIKVLRSLLERTEMNQRKDKIYDEILNEFGITLTVHSIDCAVSRAL